MSNHNLETKCTTFIGNSFARPLLMGIVNVTPDSFSDGGETLIPEIAIARAIELYEQGADIVDVGGESTRPGAKPVSIDQELNRVVPVINALSEKGYLVSVDTRNSSVMTAAIHAGASIINDVSALEHDKFSLDVVANSSASVILMHMQGQPETMQQEPIYGDVVSDVRGYLVSRVTACEHAGINRNRIAIDPGIGFGKTLAQNILLLKNLCKFSDIGLPIVLGVSRKSFIGRLTKENNPKRRIAGSLSAGLACVANGASILRVHDVLETRQALDVWQAIQNNVVD